MLALSDYTYTYNHIILTYSSFYLFANLDNVNHPSLKSSYFNNPSKLMSNKAYFMHSLDYRLGSEQTC